MSNKVSHDSETAAHAAIGRNDFIDDIMREMSVEIPNAHEASSQKKEQIGREELLRGLIHNPGSSGSIDSHLPSVRFFGKAFTPKEL